MDITKAIMIKIWNAANLVNVLQNNQQMDFYHIPFWWVVPFAEYIARNGGNGAQYT